MPYRKNIHIKTHYKTKTLCIEKLVDHKKKTFFSLFIRQISGLITADGYFEISSRFNVGAFFEFKGQVIENEEGIVLTGDIEAKKTLKIYMIIISILCMLSSPIYINAWGIYGVLFMIIMFIDICVVFGYFKYSDALYKDILRKIELNN